MNREQIRESAQRIVNSHLQFVDFTKRQARIELLDELAAEFEQTAATLWEVGGAEYKFFQALSHKMTEQARRERAEVDR